MWVAQEFSQLGKIQECRRHWSFFTKSSFGIVGCEEGHKAVRVCMELNYDTLYSSHYLSR